MVTHPPTNAPNFASASAIEKTHLGGILGDLSADAEFIVYSLQIFPEYSSVE